ncbi:hypothetical protein B0H13DRAFT_2576681, partial [Mycena leptocephala]
SDKSDKKLECAGAHRYIRPPGRCTRRTQSSVTARRTRAARNVDGHGCLRSVWHLALFNLVDARLLRSGCLVDVALKALALLREPIERHLDHTPSFLLPLRLLVNALQSPFDVALRLCFLEATIVQQLDVGNSGLAGAQIDTGVNIVVEDTESLGVGGVEVIVPGDSAVLIEPSPANAGAVHGVHDSGEIIVVGRGNARIVVLSAQHEVIVHPVTDGCGGDELNTEPGVEAESVPADAAEGMVVDIVVSHALRQLVEVVRESSEAEGVAERILFGRHGGIGSEVCELPY